MELEVGSFTLKIPLKELSVPHTYLRSARIPQWSKAYTKANQALFDRASASMNEYINQASLKESTSPSHNSRRRKLSKFGMIPSEVL